jgi:hypothetical protein
LASRTARSTGGYFVFAHDFRSWRRAQRCGSKPSAVAGSSVGAALLALQDVEGVPAREASHLLEALHGDERSEWLPLALDDELIMPESDAIQRFCRVLYTMSRTTSAKPYIHIATCIVLLMSAMLLPFLPGRYDPLAISLSTFSTAVAFGTPLLVPTGAAWLISRRGSASAKVALAVATLVVAGAALATAASGSMAAGAVIMAAWLIWLVHLWRRVAVERSGGGDLPRAVPIGLILVPLAATVARLALAQSAADWSRDRAIVNAAEMIAEIERFQERHGTYPVAISSVWPDYQPGIIGVERYRYEPSGDAYNLYFEHPSTNLAVREIVMFNPRGEQDISSHAFDLLRLTPEEIRRQRGYFTSHQLPQAGWKRFLFD